MKYNAQERLWVMRLLARLTPDQRTRYELACRAAPRDHRSGKLYDGEKAKIAERILYDDARAKTGTGPLDSRALGDNEIIRGEAHARSSDPDTSKAAARRVHAASLERKVVASMKLDGPGTIKEIAGRLGLHEWSISPRFAPLVRQGLIRDSGQRRNRSIVWEAE